MEHEPQPSPEQQPTPEQQASTDPKVWLGALSAYNSGILHGDWFEAAQEPDELYGQTKAMLATSPIPGEEEYYLGDSEGFHGVRLFVYESMENICKLARGIKEYGEAYARYVKHVGGTDHLDHAAETFADAYHGHFESERAAAEDYMESAGVYEAVELARQQVTESLRGYITVDHESWIENTDMYMAPASNGGVYLFDPQ